MMKVFHFTEQPYPEAWDQHQGSLRVVLPNRIFDPKIAADRFHRYYDEWQLADELGYDIMVNEHHSTATCMASTRDARSASVPRGRRAAARTPSNAPQPRPARARRPPCPPPARPSTRRVRRRPARRAGQRGGRPAPARSAFRRPRHRQ